MAKKLLVWFKDVDKEDIGLVGGKGANLGEMTRNGFPVPPGFIVTAEAYREFLVHNDLEKKISHLLHLIDYSKQESLEKISKQIESLITQGKLTQEFVAQVFTAYAQLGNKLSQAVVAVRSSATAEDLPTASFAGQQVTFLNVVGEANLLLRIKGCWASLFRPRAIFYRHENHINQEKVAIAVPVQKMIESDTSGVMFSIDPVTNNKNVVVIEAIYGLGEFIVQGKVTPDHYEVDKSTLQIVAKKIATQKIKFEKKGNTNATVNISPSLQSKQKITDEQIIALAKLAKQLEHHYYFPQDAEWAIEKDTIYMVQSRPVTTVAEVAKKENIKVSTVSRHVLLTGDPASPGVASGPVTIVHSAKEIGKVKNGDVLVAEQTNPDFVPAMRKAVAIVTDKGGRTSHAAIVARELGIPAIVGTEHATTKLTPETIITVNGQTGEIFLGGTLSQAVETPLQTTIHTATKLYVNMSEPDIAQKTALRHVDGVGLLRAEFMMAGIGVHPKKMIHEKKEHQFIGQLAEGIMSFAKSFTPRPVVYRASDLKTNEYRELLGGKEYEPIEPNPLLGYRGAFRYMQDPDVFRLELQAIKKVREKGYKNVWLMIPFVRTLTELREVKKLITDEGLFRSASFKLWMMVEVPSNVILLDKYIEEGIDGISIGSNDLTMLTLGVDRDNHEIATEFNEQDGAMLWAYEHCIKTAHKYGITSSLCGQAASIYPSLLKHLVDWGITSVSVSPDVVDVTRNLLASLEKEKIR